jgi:hypothetical protein
VKSEGCKVYFCSFISKYMGGLHLHTYLSWRRITLLC